MTELRTKEAALDAERTTALSHMEDLKSLMSAMEGDREKKQALMDAMRQENQRISQ